MDSSGCTQALLTRRTRGREIDRLRIFLEVFGKCRQRFGVSALRSYWHPNQERDRGQRIFVVQREQYVYLVPFVEDEKLIVRLGPRLRRSTSRRLNPSRSERESMRSYGNGI